MAARAAISTSALPHAAASATARRLVSSAAWSRVLASEKRGSSSRGEHRSAVSITATSSPSGASGFLFVRYVTFPGPRHVPEGGGGRSATPTAAASDGARRRSSAATAARSFASPSPSPVCPGVSVSSPSSASVPSTHERNLSATTRERAVPAPATEVSGFPAALGGGGAFGGAFALDPKTLDLALGFSGSGSGSGGGGGAPVDLSISAVTSSASPGSARAADASDRCTSPHRLGGGPFAPPTETARRSRSRVGARDESR